MAHIFRRFRRHADQLRWRQRDLTDRLLFSVRREAHCVARFRESLPSRALCQRPVRLLVDISVIHRHDAGTGIQRVVRSLRDRLRTHVGSDVAIDHAIVERMRDGYVTIEGSPLTGGPDQLFFGLDFATDAVFQAQKQLEELRRSGTTMWFLVHDILPISHPHWFTYPSRLKYRRWLRTCAKLADGIFCVSPDVAEKLEYLMATRYGRKDMPRIVTISPGSDIVPEQPVPAPERLPQAANLDVGLFARSVLIVGTLEPRKGHADALAAFDHLWRTGHQIPLVLIGRPGWNTSALQRSIRDHAQHGRLLFWFDDIDDEALQAAYQHCGLTLVPSLAEGYGLPLDEALALGSPVLARDIPVFHRHPRANVHYFPNDASPRSIASAVLEALNSSQNVANPADLPNWDLAAQQIAQAFACAVGDASLTSTD